MNGIESAVYGVVEHVSELKETQRGHALLLLTLGVDTGFEHEDGERIIESIEVVCFGFMAEELAETIRKCDRLYVEGRARLKRCSCCAGATLSILVSKAEKLGVEAIGRNRPKRVQSQQADVVHGGTEQVLA
jgi:hypothetical protein